MRDSAIPPRPLIRAMIQVVDPQIGETIYDGACGSAGFLCESFDYLRHGGFSNSPPLGAPRFLFFWFPPLGGEG